MALLGALASCSSAVVDTRPDVIGEVFAKQAVRVEITGYASEPTGFPGLLSEGLVSLDQQAARAHRQLWVVLATSGFLVPVSTAQAKESGADLTLDVAIGWVCKGGHGPLAAEFGCDGLYGLTAHDPSGRIAWRDRIPLGRVTYVSGLTAADFRLQAEHLMEDANRLALRRLEGVLGPR